MNSAQRGGLCLQVRLGIYDNPLNPTDLLTGDAAKDADDADISELYHAAVARWRYVAMVAKLIGQYSRQ